MTVKADTGLHITWPRIEPGKRTNERIDELARLFKQARAYHELRKADDTARFDPRLESLGPLLRKESKLFVHANSLLSIQSAVAFAEQHRVGLVIVGGYDAPRAARLLKRHKVRVIVTGTHRLPRHRHAPYDEPFTVPRRLHEAGVRFCISSGGPLRCLERPKSAAPRWYRRGVRLAGRRCRAVDYAQRCPNLGCRQANRLANSRQRRHAVRCRRRHPRSRYPSDTRVCARP